METFKETLTIQTPESVGFQYVLAGVGSRAAAFLLDTAIRFIAVLSIFVFITLMGALLPKLDFVGITSWLSKSWLIALGVLAYGFVDLGYFVFFEALWSGQTPGKRHQRLRVIRSNGRPISWLESGIRNILRALDLLAGFYPLGLIVVFLSRNNQRIGDYAAGTVVVMEEKTPSFHEGIPSRDLSTLTHPEIENYISLLDRSQYRLLKSFLQRRKGMDDKHKHELARMLALQLLSKWGMPARLKISYETFLEEVLILYEQRKRAI
jgi:uncharacterized RDD family membrane protein YckC